MISNDLNDHLSYESALDFYKENDDQLNDDNNSNIPVASAKMTEHYDLETNKTLRVLHEQFKDSINYVMSPTLEEREEKKS